MHGLEMLKPNFRRVHTTAPDSGYRTATAHCHVATLDDALTGARDILAETISDHPEVRKKTRAKALQWGSTKTEKIASAEDPKGTYRDYYEFDFRVDKLRPPQEITLKEPHVA